MLRGSGLRMVSMTASSRGSAYRTERALSFCVPAYESVRKSSGRLEWISWARY
jgi:hypothetical protein